MDSLIDEVLHSILHSVIWRSTWHLELTTLIVIGIVVFVILVWRKTRRTRKSSIFKKRK